MKQIHSRMLFAGSLLCSSLTGCSPMNRDDKVVPSLAYARAIGAGERQDVRRAQALTASGPVAATLPSKGGAEAHIRQVSAQDAQSARFRYAADSGSAPAPDGANDVVTNIAPELADDKGFQVYQNSAPNIRDYNGPLSLGDPGVSASLWQESRGETNLFHDFRAWQPMDLITILVTERSEGKKEADTSVKSESTFQAALENFFGYENDIEKRNSDKDGKPKVDLANLINASTSSEFKGEGDTSRTDTLKAQISAMVVEVLPGGILRIEGERIISMNNEEQIMIISGLARTRDITSDNQIDSAKIANLRIDYFGRGTIGGAQYGGWFTNLLRLLWPF